MLKFFVNNKLILSFLGLILGFITWGILLEKYTDVKQDLAEKACALNFPGGHATLLESGNKFSCYTQAKGAQLIVGHMTL